MKTKIKIEIEEDRKQVEFIGSPAHILIELGSFLQSSKETAYILETALKFSKVMEKDFEKYEAKKTNEPNKKPNVTDYSAESLSIVEEFISNYHKNVVKKN